MVKTSRVLDKIEGQLYDSVFALSSGRVTSIGAHGEFNWQVWGGGGSESGGEGRGVGGRVKGSEGKWEGGRGFVGRKDRGAEWEQCGRGRVEKGGSW